jgi:NADH-quinone oxidoreductase subunit A
MKRINILVYNIFLPIFFYLSYRITSNFCFIYYCLCRNFDIFSTDKFFFHSYYGDYLRKVFGKFFICLYDFYCYYITYYGNYYKEVDNIIDLDFDGNYFNIFYCIIYFFFLSFILFLLSFNLVEKHLDNEKLTSYECGFDPFSNAREKFDIHFYVVSLFFIIFDVEALFIFPWILSFSNLELSGFFSMLDFLIELVIGYLYIYFNNGFKWR